MNQQAENVQSGKVAESQDGRLVMLVGDPTISVRVADLARRIASGGYRVSPDLVAEKLMARMLAGGRGVRVDSGYSRPEA